MGSIFVKKGYISALILGMALSSCAHIKQPSPGPSPTVNSSINGEKVEVNAPPTQQEFPEPEGFVNDFANVLAAEDEQALEDGLKKVQELAKVDRAIAMVSSTGRQSAFDYSLAMAKEWKVGSANGGILLLVAVEDRKWHIQIDKKLEKIFTNDQITAIGGVMTPDLRHKNYAGAVKKCINKLIEALAKKLQFAPFKVS